ncbi:undecaprenyl-diphosphate phosphatase [Gymnodinialimonas sp. 2305UL16-5]|uniref:undecaprenyl-diphosphate phosphatase n=1 Tax=Gymnodinialimonas mytili TaxID=3126503 RepID=UPI0030A4B11D
MTFLHLFLLAMIQGITEFLPVSSSGHLILLPGLTGLEDQGQVIDVAAHVGTLGAVVLYFWTDVKTALIGTPRMLMGRLDTPGAKLAFLLLISTIPVILFGIVLEMTGLYEHLRSIAVIGWTMLIFGVVLYWADQNGPLTKVAADWNRRDAIIIGLCQAISLIPGTSRSGITITAGRYLGYDREGAARIAMLMSIPTILASGIFSGAKVISQADATAAWDGAIAAALSFVAALLALILMFRLLKSVSFTPYVIYRVVLGVILLWIAYS